MGMSDWENIHMRDIPQVDCAEYSISRPQKWVSQKKKILYDCQAGQSYVEENLSKCSHLCEKGPLDVIKSLIYGIFDDSNFGWYAYYFLINNKYLLFE